MSRGRPEGTLASEPRQASLRRMRTFGIRPNVELGQNFLIDDNLLEVIGRAAELSSHDVVLEVGGGLGVLSEHLAPRVRHLHVVEVDPALEPALREALRPYRNATLHLVDVMELDLRTLSPSPSKMVANLPYGVAATVLLKSIWELPEADLWVAMVQREVAERLAADPGTKTYGASSVLAKLACRVKLLRRVPPAVFHPAPHVESALVRLTRHSPAPAPAVTALVHAGFAHRRKALPTALGIAPGAGPELKARARKALEELGQPPDARAERLSPAQWTRLAELIGVELLAPLRPRSTEL